MNYSDTALEVLAAKDLKLIKSAADFWTNYATLSAFKKLVNSYKEISQTAEKLRNQFKQSEDSEFGIICAFDKTFPQINRQAKLGDRPFLLLYRGNISLLENLNDNVAVIGLTNPDEDIESRERKIVEKLLDKNLVIVSGLAKGCDEIAHRVCVENNRSTVAVLPTTIQKIAPASNRDLANQIVEHDGLILTEYFREPSGRYEAVGRYIERDRLQALLSKAIIMIASYREGEGDSGSRHAMNFSKNLNTKRYVLYNNETDHDKKFALNRDYLNRQFADILHQNSINAIANLINPDLINGADTPEQLKLNIDD